MGNAVTARKRRAVRAALRHHGGKLVDVATDVAGGETVIFKLPGWARLLAFRVGDPNWFLENFLDMLEEVTKRP